MEFKQILELLKEDNTVLNEVHIALVAKILREASTTTVASLPVTLQLKSVDPSRYEKLMDIIGAFVYPVSHLKWEDFVKKFGQMSMAEFMQKTKIDANQFATSLSKTFPYINKAVVQRLK